MAFLERIFIYPIKSLDGVSVESASIADGGSLRRDREFALMDSEWKFVNAKRFPAIHRIRARFDVSERLIWLRIEGEVAETPFHLDKERPRLSLWFSDFFNVHISISQNTHQGFPDDITATGPTVVASATLRETAAWFDGLNEQDMRLRFRANLEIGGVAEAFWEDRLIGVAEEHVPFRIGNAKFYGVNPCQRCVVPTRDALTGETLSGFQKLFSEKRKATLPPWAEASRFNHFYRLSVNTLTHKTEAGRILTVGDKISLE